MSESLFNLTGEMMSLEDMLYETGGELTPEIEQALQETGDSLLQKVDNYNALIQKFKSTQEVCKSEKDRLSKIQTIAANGEKRLKEMILYVMGAYGIKKLEGKTCRMSVRRSDKMEVNEDQLLSGIQKNLSDFKDLLPEWCSVEIKINKTILKDSIKKDGVIPVGAELKDNYTLTIK